MKTLMTVSGIIPADIEERIASGGRPRADYLELARALDADLLDYGRMRAEAGWFTRLVGRVTGANAALAWTCFLRRKNYRVILTDGEQVGIPLALLLKFLGRGPLKTRHAMLVHILSVGKKMIFFDRLGIQSHVDRFLVYSTWQKQFIEKRWNVPGERVIWTPFQVDAHFFNPNHQPLASDTQSPLICSAGLEFRDYPTLMHAVEGMDVQVVLAAASPWSKRADSTQQRAVPSNVTVQRFDLHGLRDLYARAAFVVIPLYQVDFQAGVTTLLEAMAMGKAVIVTRTPGQTDVVIDGETGIYVPPSDPQALRTAMQRLLDHPEEARRLGANGRKVIETRMSLEKYVEGLKKIVDEIA
jgi:glycosyltransferase involved in cell wall biosynthesis